MIESTLRSLVALALIASAAGCGERTAPDEGVEGTGASPSEPGLRSELLVEPEWLADRIADPEVIVLYVGADGTAHETAHIPGARFVPISALSQERDGVPGVFPPREELARTFAEAGVSDGSHVVVYGAPLQAARAFLALEHLGHERVSLLDGGLPGWQAANLSVSRTSEPSAGGAFRAQPRSDIVVDAAWIRERLDDPSIVLIDARPPQQFSGEVAGDRVPRPGHIPGANNLFWEELIVSTDEPRLKDEATLRSLFRQAGASPDRTVVTYCRTGMQSSFAYFVSRYLGYETKTYDGSFVDWSPREEYPVRQGQ